MTRARDLADGKFATDVEVENSTAGAQNMLVIHHASNTSGDESKIQFKRTTDGGSDREVAAIVADRIGGNDTDLAFETNTDGADGAVEKMRLSHIGILSVDQVFGLSDTDTGIALGANGADIMQFYTGNTERARLLSGGGLDLSAGHLVLDNGYGINFAATADGSGMTGEILDDYEEGTFSPTIDSGVSSVTYTQQVGRYTKVGRQVSFMFHIDVNTASASTGQIQFGGLPFTSLNTAHVWGGAFTVYTGGAFQKQNVTWAIQGGTTRVIGYANSGATFKGTDFDSITGGWYIAGFYYT